MVALERSLGLSGSLISVSISATARWRVWRQSQNQTEIAVELSELHRGCNRVNLTTRPFRGPRSILKVTRTNRGGGPYRSGAPVVSSELRSPQFRYSVVRNTQFREHVIVARRRICSLARSTRFFPPFYKTLRELRTQVHRVIFYLCAGCGWEYVADVSE